MNYDDHIEALRRDGPRMHAAAVSAGVEAVVPSCPEWTVGELLRHVGRLQRWVTDLVANRPDDPMRAWAEPLPEDDAVLEWFSAGIEPLAAAFGAAGPDTPAWSWTTDHT